MIAGLHHVGCLVESIEEAIKDYLALCPDAIVSPVFNIADQKVHVCFFEIKGNRIEFVEPLDKQSSLYRLLSKKTSYYHTAFLTDDIMNEISRLEDAGYRKINLFRSEAFNDNYCAFLYNNEMHLIELIERTDS